MDQLKAFASKLKEMKSIALFAHKDPDGDAFGSLFSMKAILENSGIRANVYLEKPIAEKFSFLDGGYIIGDPSGKLSEDAAFALDCGALARLGSLAPLYMTAPVTLCLDHHRTSDLVCDFSYIRPEAAATCELVYALSKEFSDTIPYEAMKGIYTGISTDTGHFKYSNTTENTLKIAAELLARGLDFRKITERVYDTVKISKFRFLGAAFDKIKIYDDSIAVLDAREEFLKQYGLAYEDLEELPSLVSNIEGIKVGVLIKSGSSPDCVRISFRGRDIIDLSHLASHFGGGGHKNAAACVMPVPVDDAIEKIVEKIKAMLKD